MPLLPTEAIETSSEELPPRSAGRLVGGLFIMATVAGVVSLVLQQPVTGAADYLTEAINHGSRLAAAAVLELVMAAAIVSIAVAAHPVIARTNPRLAIGYVAARSIEGAMFAVDTIGLLIVVFMSRTISGGAAAESLEVIGSVVVAGRELASLAVGALAFSAGAFILNYVLFRRRLVPAWLALWGLIGALMYHATFWISAYGLEGVSSTQTVLAMPLAVQEMALAAWLVVKGFNARTDDSERLTEHA